MPKPRLHPLDKPRFLESNNQIWCAILVAIGLGMVVAEGMGWIKDPGPFLTYFTGLGMSFILGASGADIMRAYRVDSSYRTDDASEVTTQNSIQTVIAKRPRDFDDPSIP